MTDRPRNDADGTPCFLDRDPEPSPWADALYALALMVGGIALACLALEAGVRVGLRLAGRV